MSDAVKFNIALSLRGDFNQGKSLHRFIAGPPVKTPDHTETTLVNAVKDVLLNPGSNTSFSFNPKDDSSASPESEYLRVDASIWIGTDGAPGGWHIPGLKDGWNPESAGSARHLGHPAVCRSCLSSSEEFGLSESDGLGRTPLSTKGTRGIARRIKLPNGRRKQPKIEADDKLVLDMLEATDTKPSPFTRRSCAESAPDADNNGVSGLDSTLLETSRGDSPFTLGDVD
ncbi:hypothetical protein F5Y15DRAFT_411329 [Xylariaceae sp. FL0016]|nr:hypothetical protein F5Y15DRAFT_411329 [Xylariaceae sp. FL0016]